MRQNEVPKVYWEFYSTRKYILWRSASPNRVDLCYFIFTLHWFLMVLLWPLRFLVFWVLKWISGIDISPVGCSTWVFIWRYDILLSWNKYDNILYYHQKKCKVISRFWITSSYQVCDQQISTWSWLYRNQK